MSNAIKIIACDESGAEGENLLGAAHRVFAHASLDLSSEEAAEAISRIRERLHSQAPEIKSEQILLPSRRSTLEWLLSPDGPLLGRAVVYIIDKQYFTVAKVVDLLIEELAHEEGTDLHANMDARRISWALHRDGVRALGNEQWWRLMQSFNSLMRIRQRAGSKTTIDEFFELVDHLRCKARRRSVGDALDLVFKARHHAEEFQGELLGSDGLPALDPLAAALPQTVRIWAEESKCEVGVIHDEQAMLTPSRIRLMILLLKHPHPDFASYVRPVGLRFIDQVDSRSDHRVQLADILAGVARVIASEALSANGNAERCSLIYPVLGDRAIWSDPKSWRVMTGKSLDEPIR